MTTIEADSADYTLPKLNIKSELEEVQFESSDYEDYSEKSKCGTIFVGEGRKYIFVCEYCSAHYEDMLSFAQHLEEEHLNVDQQATSVEGTSTIVKLEGDSNDCSAQEPTVNGNAPDVDEGLIEFDDEGLFCFICSRQYISKSNFTIHKRSHKSDQISYFCDICKGNFKTLVYLRAHVLRQHGNEIPDALKNDPTYLTCRFCYKEFVKPLERHEHETNHNNEDKPYRCPKCEKTFKSRHQRELHLRVHTGVRPYKCPHCSQSFTCISNRSNHIRLHLGIKRYECEECKKKFATNYALNQHAKMHQPEKPFSCDECNASYRTKRRLKEHKDRHLNKATGQIKCNECEKTFANKYFLADHALTHLKVKPFNCPVCNKMFTRKSTLKRHQQEIHDLASLALI